MYKGKDISKKRISGHEFNTMYLLNRFIIVTDTTLNTQEIRSILTYLNIKNMDKNIEMELYNNFTFTFANEKDIYELICQNQNNSCKIKYMRHMIIPATSIIIIDGDIFKVDKIFLQPMDVISKDIYLEAVRTNGNLLKYVPIFLKDKYMCMEAVRQNYGALRFVPRLLKDNDICIEAVKQHYNAVKYVPDSLKNKDICMEIVKQDSDALNYIPYKLRDLDICTEAVKYHPNAIYYVPDKIKHMLSDMSINSQSNEKNKDNIDTDSNAKNTSICNTFARTSNRALKYVSDIMMVKYP